MSEARLDAALAERLVRCDRDRVVERLWARDVALWGGDASTPELGDRLGWLDLPTTMGARLPEMIAFADEVRTTFDRVVLCGMGGSSLAPEVLWRTFGARTGYPSLHPLDSTHPDAVRGAVPDGALGRTLFLIASKSGTTLETASFEEYFWELTGGAASQFAAVTDPDTALARRAAERGYRRVVLSPPDVGGRFSALSPFGLVPAAVMGIDVSGLLARAAAATDECRRASPENPGVRLGVLMGDGAHHGKDKLTLLADEALAGFGLWVEQLIAESTGKHGTGVLPVVGEMADELSGDERDRVFAVRSLGAAQADMETAAGRLGRAGGLVDVGHLQDARDLGAEFFRWEFATALAGSVLGVNPFDQPNVAESKANTVRVLDTGAPAEPPDDPARLPSWLAAVRPGDYVALMLWGAPTVEVDAQLANARRELARRTQVPVTVGYGPRFLHSTGQLHKGGPAHGHFLQVMAPAQELPIPGKPYGFGRLIEAQADGDRAALVARGRPVLRLATLDALLAAVA